MGTPKDIGFPEEHRVRLVNDPTRIGIWTRRELPRGNRRMLQILFPEGPRWVPDSQVEFVDSVRLPPLDMLESGKLGRPIDLRRTLTHVKLSGRLIDVIYSMEATNTDFYAYQFKPVVKILESPSNGLLIADEVGLGKTIEAGLIWTELRSRFDMRRLLVLCPAALREKWYYELSTKVGVSAQICNAEETLRLLQNKSARSRGFAIIASIQGLRPPRDWKEDNNKQAAARLARFLQEMENEERLVDLLVIDEAHHLRNPETLTNQLARLCKGVSEYCILLTATPIHNKNQDLFSLLQLLDPDTFNRIDIFQQILDANAPLVEARDLLLGRNPDSNELKKLLRRARNHPLLRSSRQLSMIDEAKLNSKQLARREIRSRLAYRLETVNLLAHVITRTRKRDVKEWRVIREPIPEFVDRDPLEARFYDLVSQVVIDYARRQQRATNELFLLAQPQRQMTSSMAAALRLWQSKIVDLEVSEITGESTDEERKNELGPLVKEIVRRSRNYVDLKDLIRVDTKYARLKSILQKFFRNYPTEKVVLFSAFHSTLDYLAERLEEDGISCIRLKGGQRETKADTIAAFMHPNGPRVLLSSEVGAEGVDLQFSRVVINYDLPWNPMRLEQRIGRIDRLGQRAEKVLIWNILYSDTIDARIYKRLYEKLDLCRTALGDFEAILGDEIRRLEIDLLSQELSPEQQEQRIDQTAQALENRKLEEQRLEREAATLVAYGDYLLTHIQAARELNRWITGDDIYRYVSDYLRVHYPGCELRQLRPNSPVYELSLSVHAKYDLSEFIRHKRLSFSTKLISEVRAVRCRFESRATISLTDQTEEIISQFHPLVRMIRDQIEKSHEQLTPAVALKLNRTALDDRLGPGTYVLTVQRWSFHGLQDTEKLAYAATSLEDPSRILDEELAERLAAASVTSGTDWLEAPNEVDLDQVFKIANDKLMAKLDDEYEVFEAELRAKNEDRVDIQLKTLDQHLNRQLKKFENVKRTHQINKRHSLVKATEGRIQKLIARVQQQRLEIEKRREVRTEKVEIAIAIIRIE